MGALAAGIVAIATSVWAPQGLIGDLLVLVVAVCALLFSLDASRRRGPLRGAAIAGALLAGLAMITPSASATALPSTITGQSAAEQTCSVGN